MSEMYAVSGETLTGIANAIRGKTGSDDFLTVDSMASAIEAISSSTGGESGGSFYELKANSLSFANLKISPGIKKLEYFEQFPRDGMSIRALQLTGVDDFSFHYDFLTNSMTQAFRECKARRIGLFFDMSQCAAIDLAFYGCSDLEEIYGTPLDFTQIEKDPNGPFSGCVNLRRVFFKANTIRYNIRFDDCRLLEMESIISIANGLSDSAAGKTIRLHNDVKEKCASIFGDELDGVFIVNSSGSTRLSDFITNTKGFLIS